MEVKKTWRGRTGGGKKKQDYDNLGNGLGSSNISLLCSLSSDFDSSIRQTFFSEQAKTAKWGMFDERYYIFFPSFLFYIYISDIFGIIPWQFSLIFSSLLYFS